MVLENAELHVYVLRFLFLKVFTHSETLSFYCRFVTSAQKGRLKSSVLNKLEYASKNAAEN